jgi:type IV fimbrial biogenesis protein FimT
MGARQSQRGFTLVELVVAMAVLALILFAAMPSIGNWLDNTRVRNTADSIQIGLQTARAEAIRRNQNMSLWLVALNDPGTLDNDCTLSDSSGSWVVSINSPLANCGQPPSTQVSPMIVTGRAVGGGRPVTVAALQSDATAANSVTFDGFGRVTGTGSISRINVSGSATRNLRIEISTAGAIRLCDVAASSSNDPRKCTP